MLIKNLYTGRVVVVSEQHSNNKNTISLSTEKKDIQYTLSNFNFSLSDLDFKTIRETSLNISKWLVILTMLELN